MMNMTRMWARTIILLPLILSLLSGCSRNPVGSMDGTGTIAIHAGLSDQLSDPSATILGKTCALQGVIINSMTIQISGSGMSKITRDYEVTGSTLSATISGVPVGATRLVEVFLHNRSGITLLQGSSSVGVLANQTSNADINLEWLEGEWINFNEQPSDSFLTPPPDKIFAIRFTPKRYPCYLTQVAIYVAHYDQKLSGFRMKILDTDRKVLWSSNVGFPDASATDEWMRYALYNFNLEINSSSITVVVNNQNNPDSSPVPWIGAQLRASSPVQSYIGSNSSDEYWHVSTIDPIRDWYTPLYRDMKLTFMIRAAFSY